MQAEQIKCPCCGQRTMPLGAVRVSLDENLLYFRDQSLPLTGRLAELAYILAQQMPNTVADETIMAKMWGGMERTDKSRHVAILELRRAIHPLGLRILNTKGAGYRMAVALTPRTPHRIEEHHASA